jgi:hypothetical protein
MWQNPQPHISLVWALGDISSKLKQAIKDIEKYQSSMSSYQKCNVRCEFNRVVCKVGKKMYDICKLADWNCFIASHEALWHWILYVVNYLPSKHCIFFFAISLFSLSVFAFEGQRSTPYVLFFCCSRLVQQKRGARISCPVRNYCHVHAASLVWHLDTFQCFQVVQFVRLIAKSSD